MVNNYYTLYALVREIKASLLGKTVSEIYTQERNVLTLSFNESRRSFVISCEPTLNYLLLKDGIARARRNTVDLLDQAIGRCIEDVDIARRSREIVCSLSGEYIISFQFFGSKANVILVDPSSTIVDAFLHRKELINTQYTVPELLRGTSPFLEVPIAIEHSDKPLLKYVKESIPMLGSDLAREALVRMGLHETALWSTLTHEQREQLRKILQELQVELIEKISPRIYFLDAMPKTFSLIALKQFDSENVRVQLFNSVSEAVRTYIASTAKCTRVETERTAIQRALTKQIEQTERTLDALQKQRASLPPAELYEKYGTLLLTSLHTFSRGDREVTVQDPETQQEITIHLEPQLQPAKNAERYFQRARKVRKTLTELEERIQELQQKLEQLTMLIDELVSSDDVKSFVEAKKSSLAKLGIQYSQSSDHKKEVRLPFRIFTVAGGFQVLAGKNSENNDLLTTRYTAKDDLWFHAHGVGGSHVVLKVHSAKGAVSQKAIEEAASIAAYYSKMRKASMVPVTMCEGKYVRKPKGAPPGTVLVEREKTLFVEPRLPESPSDEEEL